MGTRNLTCVVLDGEYKVAQYGQWDGYIESAGVGVLEFLNSVDIEKFKAKLKEVSFVTEDEIKSLDEDWKNKYPRMDRDQGYKVLNSIMIGDNPELHNSISFASDSLFCEWAYVIDLDDMTLEIYNGFNKKPILNGRFLSEDSDSEGGYGPIVLSEKYDIKNLPTKDELIARFEEVEDE